MCSNKGAHLCNAILLETSSLNCISDLLLARYFLTTVLLSKQQWGSPRATTIMHVNHELLDITTNKWQWHNLWQLCNLQEWHNCDNVTEKTNEHYWYIARANLRELWRGNTIHGNCACNIIFISCAAFTSLQTYPMLTTQMSLININISKWIKVTAINNNIQKICL